MGEKELANNALEGIYLACRNQLARAVSRIVPPHDIEDIVQETYVRLCLVENTDEIHHPKAYLLKMARNLALDQVKRADSRLNDPLPDDENENETFNRDHIPAVDKTYAEAVSDEEFALFCHAVRHLPLQCRKVFVLKKVYGYSQREVAAELAISESTVEKHIASGIKRCLHFMNRHTESDGAQNSSSMEQSV